jgi:Tfp pilus assembly protein PilV
MKYRNRYFRRRRGSSFIEVMVAGIIISIGVMALVSMWSFSYRMTMKSEDTGMSYVLARQATEAARIQGFTSAAEGTATTYYSGGFSVVSGDSASARYKVVTSVTSSAVSSGTIGQAGAVPATTAIRTVSVTVSLKSTNEVMHRMATYLVSGGI